MEDRLRFPENPSDSTAIDIMVCCVELGGKGCDVDCPISLLPVSGLTLTCLGVKMLF